MSCSGRPRRTSAHIAHPIIPPATRRRTHAVVALRATRWPSRHATVSWKSDAEAKNATKPRSDYSSPGLTGRARRDSNPGTSTVSWFWHSETKRTVMGRFRPPPAAPTRSDVNLPNHDDAWTRMVLVRPSAQIRPYQVPASSFESVVSDLAGPTKHHVGVRPSGSFASRYSPISAPRPSVRNSRRRAEAMRYPGSTVALASAGRGTPGDDARLRPQPTTRTPTPSLGSAN